MTKLTITSSLSLIHWEESMREKANLISTQQEKTWKLQKASSHSQSEALFIATLEQTTARFLKKHPKFCLLQMNSKWTYPVQIFIIL